MHAVTRHFDFAGRIDRKAFWKGWSVQLGLSIFLIALWLQVDARWPGGMAIVALLPPRLVLFGLQMSLYVRRLRDGGRSVWWILILLGIYAVMCYIFARIAVPAMDLSLECRQTGYDDCGDASAFSLMAGIAGYGVLTGFPGFFSLLFALGIGALRSQPAKAANGLPDAKSGRPLANNDIRD